MSFRHKLWLDLETRSRVNLLTHGPYVYRECPDHRVLIAAWALDDGPTEGAILPPTGVLPLKLRNMLADKHVQVRAHNAAFDRLQLEEQAPPIERWYCTMTQARAMALPGSLENLGRALGARIRKSQRGSELIRLLSIPLADGTFCDDPKLMKEFKDYCVQDIATMRYISESLNELDDFMLQVYHASEVINDRGLPIDRELCRMAVDYAAEEKKQAEADIYRLTNGALSKVKGTSLTDWVYEALEEETRKPMDTVKTVAAGASKNSSAGGGGSREGSDIFDGAMDEGNVEVGRSLTADIRANLLELAKEEPGRFPPHVIAVIEAAEAGSLTSVGKFKAMLNRCSSDGRLRGAFSMNGAYQTGRWSSVGAQVHNYARLCAENPEAVIKLMRSHAPLGDTLTVLKSMLRPAICPGRGRQIVRCDWNAIEARGLPWLADSPGALKYLEAFKVKGRDIYIEQAKASGLGDDARQPGKVVVLSLGYGGGENALGKMAKNYGVRIDAKQAVVRRWRMANPWASDKTNGWWAKLMRAAHHACLEPGTLVEAGRVGLQSDGHNLTMLLPSGRRIWYPLVSLEQGKWDSTEIAYLKASWRPKKDATIWPRGRLWHGTLAENATQAAMNDILRCGVVEAVRRGLDVIGHVHDEIICESSTRDAKTTGNELHRVMLSLPSWADGLPLAAEVDISPRFRK